MTTRHALLAVLVESEGSGYALAKVFETSVGRYWATDQATIYRELKRSKAAGYVDSIQVEGSTATVYRINAQGRDELDRFAQFSSKPSTLQDDLMLKLQVVDSLSDKARRAVMKQLKERVQQAQARVKEYETYMSQMRGSLDEETFLLKANRIGPYLTCRGGRDFETGNAAFFGKMHEWLSERYNIEEDGDDTEQ